ncbi:MAG TPA: hypothetical protein VMK53_03980 [Gemmatimonadales bacterium]|nr:hypothetical protein [Gemmatimonadales bacterium]
MTAPAKPFTSQDGSHRTTDSSMDGDRTARGAVADGIDSVANSITTGGEHVADGARSAAHKMESSANWLRDTSGKDIANSFEKMVKEHPGRTLVGAVVVGFLAGRMVRGD